MVYVGSQTDIMRTVSCPQSLHTRVSVFVNFQIKHKSSRMNMNMPEEIEATSFIFSPLLLLSSPIDSTAAKTK